MISHTQNKLETKIQRTRKINEDKAKYRENSANQKQERNRNNNKPRTEQTQCGILTFLLIYDSNVALIDKRIYKHNNLLPRYLLIQSISVCCSEL